MYDEERLKQSAEERAESRRKWSKYHAAVRGAAAAEDWEQFDRLSAELEGEDVGVVGDGGDSVD